jgi:hypothetical protein
VTVRGLLSLAAAVATLASGAPAPDAHDRALAAKLDAGVATLRKLATPSSNTADSALKRCAALNGANADKEFEAAIAVTPVLLGELVHQYKPQLVELQQTIEDIHPDSPLFARWIAALKQSFTLTLRFDTHGRQIDLCKAAAVILDKSSTAADWQRVLGYGPALFAKLFSSKAGSTLTALDPKMRAFFVAAGIPARNAKTLTS